MAEFRNYRRRKMQLIYIKLLTFLPMENFQWIIGLFIPTDGSSIIFFWEKNALLGVLKIIDLASWLMLPKDVHCTLCSFNRPRVSRGPSNPSTFLALSISKIRKKSTKKSFLRQLRRRLRQLWRRLSKLLKVDENISVLHAFLRPFIHDAIGDFWFPLFFLI